MPYTLIDAAKALLAAFAARGVGHTQAVLNGARNVPEAIVIAGNTGHARQLNEALNGGARGRARTLEQVASGQLVGLHAPVVLDNYALTLLLMALLNEVDSQKQAVQFEIEVRRSVVEVYEDKIKASETKLARYVDAAAELGSHRTSWREALVEMQSWAGRLTPPESTDERAYWQHELKAFDEAFALLRPLR